MRHDLIIVEQLPVIVTKLKGISEDIKKKVDAALALECSEENVRIVKAYRAELNKDKAEIEALRKEVKKKVLAPYEEFEAVYKEYITDIYADADKRLKADIEAVEGKLKSDREEKIKKYFEELKKAEKIDFIEFADAKVNITLSASEKSLKDAVYAFVKKVADELDIIEAQGSYKDEILYEYKKSLELSKSIMTVAERHRELDKENNPSVSQTADSSLYTKEPSLEDKPLEAPKVTAESDEKEYTMTFTVHGTRKILKMIKDFLEKWGIKYE